MRPIYNINFIIGKFELGLTGEKLKRLFCVADDCNKLVSLEWGDTQKMSSKAYTTLFPKLITYSLLGLFSIKQKTMGH